MSIVLNLFSRGSSASQNFTTPINLRPGIEYEVGLKMIAFYNSVQNISTTNNKFYYSADGGTTYKTITFDEGSYEINNMNDIIARAMILNGDVNTDSEPYIKLAGNPTTLKAEFEFKSASYVIDFTQPDTFRELLGFNSAIIGGSIGIVSGNSVVNIENGISGLYFSCDLVKDSYITDPTFKSVNNGTILYSTSRTVPPGFKQVEKIDSPVYVPVNKTRISHITIRMIDQAGREVPYPSQEIITYTIILRPRK